LVSNGEKKNPFLRFLVPNRESSIPYSPFLLSKSKKKNPFSRVLASNGEKSIPDSYFLVPKNESSNPFFHSLRSNYGALAENRKKQHPTFQDVIYDHSDDDNQSGKAVPEDWTSLTTARKKV